MTPEDDEPSAYARAVATMGAGLFSGDDSLASASGAVAACMAASRPYVDGDRAAKAVAALASVLEDNGLFDEALARHDSGLDWRGMSRDATFAALVAVDAYRVATDPDAEARVAEVRALSALLPPPERAFAFAP